MAGIDIGSILSNLTGGSAPPAPAGPPPLTLADIIKELPDGATVFQLTSHDSTGKVISGKAPAPTYTLRPGDAVEIVTNDGRHFLTHANADATDIDTPTPLAKVTEPKPANPDVRNFGSTAAPDWRQYNQDSKQWEPLTGVGNGPAAAKVITRGTPGKNLETSTDGGLTWRPAAQGGAQAEAGLAWVQQQLAAGKGTQGFGTGSTWNDHELGQDIQVGYGTSVPLVNGKVTAVQDWGYGDYAVVIQRPDGSEFTIGHIQKPGYKVGDTVTPEDTVLSGGNESPISSGPQVEVRMKVNGQYVDPAKYVQSIGSSGQMTPSLHAVGAGTTLVDSNGKVIYTAPQKPTTHTVAPGDTVVDDQGHVLFTAPPKPATPPVNKAMEALQQQYETITYVQQQLAAGQMNPSDANGYLAAVKQQTAAALAGTTPFDIYKEDLTNRYNQAQVGKDILNNQMAAGNALTNDLLSQYDTGKMGLAGGNYNPIGLAQELTDQRGGNLGPQPTSDTAKALIDALNPSNPQPTIGSATTAALGPIAPGGSAGGSPGDVPLGPIAPGTGPQDNTLAQAA